MDQIISLGVMTINFYLEKRLKIILPISNVENVCKLIKKLNLIN